MWQATPEMMDPIWERVGALIPEKIKMGKEWTVVKDHPLNERFRFYRCM